MYMYRGKHSIYRVQYYLWCQASTEGGGLGTYPPYLRGTSKLPNEKKKLWQSNIGKMIW